LICGFGDWTAEKVGGNSGLTLEVDDVFAFAEKLKAKGVEFTADPRTEFFGGFATFSDSEGNELGLHSPPAGAPPN
jgi:predicted enzyme related to lactoylglutathione lyase